MYVYTHNTHTCFSARELALVSLTKSYKIIFNFVYNFLFGLTYTVNLFEGRGDGEWR